MDIVKEPKVDWLNFKWVFIGFSMVLLLAGGASLLVKGLNLGVDFTGGTLVYVKFTEPPDLERIRTSLREAGLDPQEVTRFDEPSKNQVQIRMGRIETDELGSLTEQSESVLNTLHQEFDAEQSQTGRTDLNNVSKADFAERLSQLDPDQKRSELSVSEFEEYYRGHADRVLDHRTELGGVLSSWSELDELLPGPLRKSLEEDFYLGSFDLISVESVGPKVGRELQSRARMAVLFSILGMLVYIAFRFRPIYGVAAIVALFHDVFITVGFFSISYKEISLTVIAALLTLVGYSINDTIVVFDRVRENLKLMRRNQFSEIINTSINQTLNRTIMTSGMTFLAVFALYMLGGQVLNGFSFALVVGIIVGTYSSIAIASPIVLWWQMYTDKKRSRVR